MAAKKMSRREAELIGEATAADQEYQTWARIAGRLTSSERWEKEKAFKKAQAAWRALKRYQASHYGSEMTTDREYRRNAGDRVSRTALRFLSRVFTQKIRGGGYRFHNETHFGNLKSWFGELLRAGLIERTQVPYVRITPAGKEAVREYLGLKPNKDAKRAAAGRRSAEVRAERKDRFLYEVEKYDPTLLPYARKMEHKIPARPQRMSRFEYFLQMVHDDPEAVHALAEEEAEKYVKRMAKEQWSQEQRDAVDESPLSEEELADLPEGADDFDFAAFLDDMSRPPTKAEVREAEETAQTLEQILSTRELEMLQRVLAREAGFTDRELTCFYRAAKKKLKKNGTIWR